MPTSRDTAPPQQIGRYLVERTIGAGAMGVIYLGFDPLFQRPVAIKKILTEILQGSERAEFIERFRAEAENAKRCIHPNIVELFDFVDNDDPYIVMEYVDGESLDKVLAKKEFGSAFWQSSLILQILNAVGSMHGAGVIHRDLKPSNIIIRDNFVKLTDFGISRHESSNLTSAGALLGSAAWMSPEQTYGTLVTESTDLFNIGVIYFCLVVGNHPFLAPRREKTIMNIRWETPVIPQGVHESIARVIVRSMEKEPGKRYRSAADMATALKEAYDRAAIDATVIQPRKERRGMMFVCPGCEQQYEILPQSGFCTNIQICVKFSPLLEINVDKTSSKEKSNEVRGLCLLVCDVSDSMKSLAFPPMKATRLQQVSSAIALAIADLKSLGGDAGEAAAKIRDEAYIGIIAFCGNATWLKDETGLPVIKSVSHLVDKYSCDGRFSVSDCEDDLQRMFLDAAASLIPGTDITTALRLAADVVKSVWRLEEDATAEPRLERWGINEPVDLMVHVVGTRSLSVPNVRVLIYSDGEHNVGELKNPFAEEHRSVLMTAFLGNSESQDAPAQMESLANLCPLHEKKGFWKFGRIEEYATLRKLFRMASGASGFCPECLKDAQHPE